MRSLCSGRSLDLIQIGDQGATAIGEALKVNGALTELWLNRNKIGDQGATAIAEGLKFNGVLTSLWLADNKIGGPGASAIAEALKFNGALNLKKLVMPFGIKQYPELMAACRAKGVELV